MVGAAPSRRRLPRPILFAAAVLLTVLAILGARLAWHYRPMNERDRAIETLAWAGFAWHEDTPNGPSITIGGNPFNHHLDITTLDSLAPALRGLNTRVIFLFGCPYLRNVDALRGMDSLRQVLLNNCRDLENLNGIMDLTKLERVDLQGCQSLHGTEITALQAALPNTQIQRPNEFITP